MKLDGTDMLRLDCLSHPAKHRWSLTGMLKEQFSSQRQYQLSPMSLSHDQWCTAILSYFRSRFWHHRLENIINLSWSELVWAQRCVKLDYYLHSSAVCRWRRDNSCPWWPRRPNGGFAQCLLNHWRLKEFAQSYPSQREPSEPLCRRETGSHFQEISLPDQIAPRSPNRRVYSRTRAPSH